MSCCTRFRTTWWPGDSSDVIDPDKAFNLQRRLSIIRRVVIGAAVLALICGAIYFLVMITTGNRSNCFDNSTETTSNSTLPEKQALKEDTPLQVAGVLHTNHNNSPILPPQHEGTNYTSSEEEMIAGILESNGTKDDAEDNDEKGEIALFKIVGINSTDDDDNNGRHNNMKHGNSSMSTPMHNSSHPIQIDHTNINHNHSSTFHGNDSFTVSTNNGHGRNISEEWCTSKENILECVALSKDFKSVTTFLNHDSPTNHTGRVAGYVMVKRNNSSRWRPYCKHTWSLDIAYKLCHDLGFKKLFQLQTIEISQLKLRVRKIGKGMSLDESNNLTEKSEVNSSDTSSHNHHDHDCNVGYIACDPY